MDAENKALLALTQARGELRQALADNARLRSALVDIADATDQFGPHVNFDLHSVARAAIEPPTSEGGPSDG